MGAPASISIRKMPRNLDLALPAMRDIQQLSARLSQKNAYIQIISFLSPNFPNSEFTTVQAVVDQVRQAHYRLVWIAGGSSATRSSFMSQLAIKIGCPLLMIGRALSSSILDQTAPLRPASAEEFFYDMLHSSKNDVLCLDQLEILFDETLMLKAVDLVRNASRRFVLAVSWPGIVDANSLIFGPADHPSYFRIPLSELECPVHILSFS